MADLKISQLSAATALAGTEVVPVVQGGSTKKATIDQILAPASGKGINFAAAGGDTLTIYDEGVFTPTITSASGVITTVAAGGKYTKVGTLVHVTLQIGMTTDAAVGTSNLTISGLPFSAASPEGGQLVLSNYSGGDLGVGGANGLVQVSGTTMSHVNRTVAISSRASTFYWWYAATYHTL